MTDWENIELLLAETVGPNHKEEITTGTEENKRVVKELYGAFGRGDIAAVGALLAEDVIWHLPGTVPPLLQNLPRPEQRGRFFSKSLRERGSRGLRTT